MIAAEARQVDIQPAVVIVVADRHAGGELARAANAGLSRNVGKLAVAEVAVQCIARRLATSRHVRAVGEKQVQPAVVIIVEHGHAAAERLHHQLVLGSAVFVAVRDAGLLGHINKLDGQRQREQHHFSRYMAMRWVR